MSASYRSYLMLGVPVKETSKNVEVTKYNPDTGEPYKKQVSRDVLNVGGIELLFNPEADNGVYGCVYDMLTDAYEKDQYGLIHTYYSSMTRQHGKNYVLGLIIATQGDYEKEPFNVVDSLALEGKIPKVTTELLRLGVTDEMINKVGVKLYMVMDVSY